MKIINLTQHPATEEQKAAGVFDICSEAVIKLLTFFLMPMTQDILNRAGQLAEIAEINGATHAMIGGAGYLMPALEKALLRRNIKPLHAFSRRESVETKNPDGTITKTSVFKHLGFVESGVTYE